MSLISNIKRALGFAAVEEDDDDPRTPTGYVNPFAGHKPLKPDEPADGLDDQAHESHARARDESTRLNEALRKVTAERDAAHQARLSAERRMRALTDRIYDLEGQLTDLQKEKDKLYDENRRLDVKVKAATHRQPGALAATPAQERAEWEAALEEERHNVEVLKRDLEALSMKAKIADTMVADLTAKATAANREAQEARAAIDKVKAERDALRASLRDANEELEAAEKAVEHINKFEDYKNKCDMRIAELQRTIAMKEKEIRSLNSTIEHNLRLHAEAQDLMRREIESLRTGRPMPAPAHPAGESALEKAQEQRRPERRKPKPEGDSDPQLSLF